MKKTLVAGAAILALTVVGSTVMAHSGGVYNASKVSYTDILIDGKLNDKAWKDAEVGTIDPTNVPAWQQFKTHYAGGTEAPKDAADQSATFKVAYDDTYLYFGFDVKDEAFFSDAKTLNSDFDVIEIWLDGQGTGGGKHVSAKDAVVRLAAKALNDQPSVGVARMDTGKDAWKDENLRLRPGVNVAGVVTATGYVVEASIPWAALEPWIGKHTNSMGLDVQLNDNDAGKDAKGKGIRQTILNWSGGKDNDWQDTNLFGDLLLK